MDLQKIRRTSAEILAAAVFEIFPGVELLGGSETYSGFYYDFYFPHSVHPELHIQIEERMRQIIREKREIRDLEMVAVSAKEFLKSKGHKVRAGQIEGAGLFPVVQMGSFVDLASGTHLKNTGQISYFKLFPTIPLEGREIRIMGAAYESKEELKDFFKKWNGYPKRRHEKVGENRHFWCTLEAGFAWLPEGLKAQEDLIRTFKENVIPGCCEVRTPCLNRLLSHKDLLYKLNVDSIFEVCTIQGNPDEIEYVGLLNPIEGKQIQITTSLKNMNSSLQSIGKTLNILGFSYNIRFVGSRRNTRSGKLLQEALKALEWPFEEAEERCEFPRVDFLVVDGLGRQWSAACVQAQECLNVQVIVERNLALLLEIQEVKNFLV